MCESPSETRGGFLRLTSRNPLWQHLPMIEFRTLSDGLRAFRIVAAFQEYGFL